MREIMYLLLLGPLVASGVVLPQANGPRPEDGRNVINQFASDGPARGVINLFLPSQSQSPVDRLSLELQVHRSDAGCGYGNLTIDGEPLSQSLENGELIGNGLFRTTKDREVAAFWVFQCVDVAGQPDLQLFKFNIDSIDDESAEDIGFTIAFTQTHEPEIFDVQFESSLSLAVEDSASEPTMQDDLDDIEYLESQLRELKYLIRERKLALAERTGYYSMSLADCDSLLCVFELVGYKAKHAATTLFDGTPGESSQDFPHFPHFGHGKKKHGNHTCHHPPKHGNFSHPHPPKHGNHSHPHPPPPHHKRPHLPLPICRYPPPHRPSHGHHPPKPPHHAPHDRPNHGDELPPPPPPPSHGRPDFHHPPPLGRPGQAPFPDSFTEDDGPEFPPPPPPPPPHRRHRHRPERLVPLTIGAILVAVLLRTLHKRFFLSHSASLRRQLRRADRQHRRSLRRAARKDAFQCFLARISPAILRSSQASRSDDEEKLPMHSEKYTDDDGSVDEEIAGFQNAAELVVDLIDAQDARAKQEDLPAYEESEFDSVADGCRFTPGSSDYTPSEAGGAGDILGRDAKQ